MLTKQERSQLRQLLQSPQWSAFELLAKKLGDKIRDEGSVRATEWETIQTVLTNEGKQRGIQLLIQEAYQNAQDTE